MAPALYEQFFTKVDGASFSCNICGSVIAASVGKVSNLNRHLRVVHKDMKDAAEAKSREDANARQTNLAQFAGAGKVQPYKKTSEEHKKITNLLIQAVADGYLSLSVVDRGSFRSLVNGLNPRRFDERHTAMNIAWHHQAIMDECGIGGKVAVAVTDSAANMAKAFRVCLNDGNDVDPEDELSPVSVGDTLDGDPGGRPLATTRVPCACHTLQLAVRDGLKTVPGSVARNIARVASFISSVKRSTLAAEIMDRRKEHLHVATATRWNSELRSIESFLALREETMTDLTENVPALAAKVVDEAGRKGLQELVKGEKEPTGSSVLPTVRILRLRLGALIEDLPGQLTLVARALLNAINVRFDQYGSTFKAATFLDPRWKLGVLARSAPERAQIQAEVEEELLHFLALRPPPTETDSEQGQADPEVVLLAPTSGVASARPGPSGATSTEVSPAAARPARDEQVQPPPAKRGFFDLLDDAADDPPPVIALTLRQRLVAEMAAYMREPREDRAVAGRALAYWTGQATKPLLRHCATHYLAIPASSAPSERLFSVAGRFFTPSRSRLSSEVFEALMAVKAECK
ncbi:putative AC transposase [Amphibalanus amphitrite]|uniref:Putative AC transposase n=1 Tax=Amphibalanus amphitrite TaxID=1232801 RepID=A0A6A4WZB4_AMPAM|nr:putative AC transposase [Amphibalanus amphitrite]